MTTVNRIFVGYMLVIGLIVGGILAAAPQLGDLWIKPFFWVLIASFVFDVAVVWRARTVPDLRLGMEWRLLGFAAGIAVMLLILNVTGSPAKYF
jgi:hypothetical protein